MGSCDCTHCKLKIPILLLFFYCCNCSFCITAPAWGAAATGNVFVAGSVLHPFDNEAPPPFSARQSIAKFVTSSEKTGALIVVAECLQKDSSATHSPGDVPTNKNKGVRQLSWLSDAFGKSSAGTTAEVFGVHGVFSSDPKSSFLNDAK